MFYRPEARPDTLPHNPFKALVAPRPIAWVSTINAEGRANLAPFSYFNAVSDAPPIVMIAPSSRKPQGHGVEGEPNDTLTNILATEAFVVNLVGFAQRDQMNASAAGFPADVDEFEAVGAPKAACEFVDAPRVADSAASFECRLLRRVTFPTDDPGRETSAVFGQVVGVHVRDDLIRDGRVDILGWRPLSRLGYRDYASVDATFELARPSQKT